MKKTAYYTDISIMYWDGEEDESTRHLARSTRRTAAAYVPPHLRLSSDNNDDGVSNNLESSRLSSLRQSRYRYSSRFNSPRPGGDRPPSRGRGRRRSRGPPHSAQPNPYDVTDRLDTLDLTEDADETTDNVNSSAINFDAYEDIPVEASGSNVPKSVASFDEIDLDESLKRNIERCKYENPTPIQKYAIPIAIAGRDLMACAQTGSGKTAAFCFPIISRILQESRKKVAYGGREAYPSALILSPTRELSCQVSFSSFGFI